MARLPFFYLSDTVLEIGKNTPLQNQLTGAAITSVTSFDVEIWSTGGTPARIGDVIDMKDGHQGDGYWLVNIDDDHGTSGLTRGMHVLIKITINAGAGFQLYMEMDGEVEVYRGDS